MPKAKPKTGEKRETNQPLKIDRLPESAREAITYLRNARGKTWEQIEEISARAYSKDWAKDGGGFIDWPAVDPDVLDEFSGLKLPKSSLHRWYDLRVAQVRRQILAEAETSRAFAEKFTGAGIEGANAAVINALRDEVFALASSMDSISRAQYMTALNDLTLAMTRIQRVEMQKRKVEVEERRVTQLEKDSALKRKRLESETESAAKKLSKGELTLDDINRLRERTFGLPPLVADGPA